MENLNSKLGIRQISTFDSDPAGSLDPEFNLASGIEHNMDNSYAYSFGDWLKAHPVAEALIPVVGIPKLIAQQKNVNNTVAASQPQQSSVDTSYTPVDQSGAGSGSSNPTISTGLSIAAKIGIWSTVVIIAGLSTFLIIRAVKNHKSGK